MEAVRELKTLLQNARMQEHKDRDRYEVAKFRRLRLEATLSIMRDSSDKR